MAQVDTFNRVTFSNVVSLSAQQVVSKLSGSTRMEPLIGKKRYFDNYGSIDLQEKTERAQVSTFAEIPRNRRFISRRTFFHHEAFDMDDDIVLADFSEPNSTIMQALRGSSARKKDDLIIEAFDGTAFSGEEGATSVSFDATNQDVTGDTTQIDFGKINLALVKLRAADVDGPFTVALHPNTYQALLEDDKAGSKDFVGTQTPMMAGNPPPGWMGLNWAVTSRINTYATDKRYAYVYTTEAIVHGVFQEFRTELDVWPQNSHARVLSVYGTFAATRQFENQIVRIETGKETINGTVYDA